MVQLGTKQCNQCRQHKALDQFGSANGGNNVQSSCKDCITARRAKWGRDNTERIKEYDEKKRINMPRKAYNHEDKIRFWIQRAGICLCCAKPITKGEVRLAQLDHMHPLSMGGSDTDDNIALAHKSCNAAKLNKRLEDHWIFRYNKKLDAVKLSWFELDNIITAARYRE